MDIELAEPEALRGFDISRYRPQLVCIEMHPPVARELREYFAKHGYVELELWSKTDSRNSFLVRHDLAQATLSRLEAELAAFVERSAAATTR